MKNNLIFRCRLAFYAFFEKMSQDLIIGLVLNYHWKNSVYSLQVSWGCIKTCDSVADKMINTECHPLRQSPKVQLEQSFFKGISVRFANPKRLHKSKEIKKV